MISISASSHRLRVHVQSALVLSRHKAETMAKYTLNHLMIAMLRNTGNDKVLKLSFVCQMNVVLHNVLDQAAFYPRQGMNNYTQVLLYSSECDVDDFDKTEIPLPEDADDLCYG
ncbi:hypothetical protein PR048_028183 [Dryococelus australis]|uniref:Uncharacterized protein n=1 Tax=Dryococelus australis TaxID=614101 RepID=A0ABQ9GIJ5_9NEOP|nr:hypothetical protein PR048_028183 [Dryococelus australis]